MSGTKYDSDKPRMDLLDWESIEDLAEVLTFGAAKYTAHNWRKGFVWSRLIAAAFRHLSAFARGQDKDPETGLSHLAHALACIMFLNWHTKYRKNLDDRYNETAVSTITTNVLEVMK